MTRADLLAHETYAAKMYRREAAQRSKNPDLAAQLTAWAEASEARCRAMRFGPLFGEDEPAPKHHLRGVRRAA